MPKSTAGRGPKTSQTSQRQPAAKTVTPAKPKASRRRAIKDVEISPDERVSLYAVARSIPATFQKKSGLQLPFVTYFHDPFVARQDPSHTFDEEVFVAWEMQEDHPNLTTFKLEYQVRITQRTETLAFSFNIS